MRDPAWMAELLKDDEVRVFFSQLRGESLGLPSPVPERVKKVVLPPPPATLQQEQQQQQLPPQQPPLQQQHSNFPPVSMPPMVGGGNTPAGGGSGMLGMLGQIPGKMAYGTISTSLFFRRP